jgi:ABC-type glycerol-3-phosphate transport system substrate-binding protein
LYRINIYIKLTKKKQKQMKKVIAIFAIATTLVACGGKGTTEATTDSTAVAVDTTAVTATDSTTAEIPAETVAPVATETK